MIDLAVHGVKKVKLEAQEFKTFGDNFHVLVILAERDGEEVEIKLFSRLSLKVETLPSKEHKS